MSAFPLQAKIYIWGVILAGSALFLWNMRNWNGALFWAVLAVSVCTALSVIAMERGATPSIHYSRDTIFVIFAYLIWGVPAAMFDALFAYAVQWV